MSSRPKQNHLMVGLYNLARYPDVSKITDDHIRFTFSGKTKEYSKKILEALRWASEQSEFDFQSACGLTQTRSAINEYVTRALRVLEAHYEEMK